VYAQLLLICHNVYLTLSTIALNISTTVSFFNADLSFSHQLVQFPTHGFNILVVLFTGVDTLITNGSPHFTQLDSVITMVLCSQLTLSSMTQNVILCIMIWFVNTTGIALIYSQCMIIPVADRFQAEGLAGCGHSKIARVRAYYLYCICLAVLTSLQILPVTKY